MCFMSKGHKNTLTKVDSTRVSLSKCHAESSALVVVGGRILPHTPPTNLRLSGVQVFV